MERLVFTAVVTGVPSQAFEKSNGGKYVLQNCKITQAGPLKGLVVGGTRTILNAEGKSKEPVAVGDEVQLYLTRVPSNEDPSKMVNFFEISTGSSASQDEINQALARVFAGNAQEALAEQAI